MFGLGELIWAAEKRKQELELEKMIDQQQKNYLSPEEYKEWKIEQTVERRHKEICQAIRDAGTNARPRGPFFLGCGRFY
jgi:hypothetical protein